MGVAVTTIRRVVISLLLLLLLALILSQLQGVLLSSLGAIDGSFGVRPITQGCVGVIAQGAESAARFPRGDVEFRLGLFHFRYA